MIHRVNHTRALVALAVAQTNAAYPVSRINIELLLVYNYRNTSYVELNLHFLKA
jgi:hypothetical protein